MPLWAVEAARAVLDLPRQPAGACMGAEVSLATSGKFGRRQRGGTCDRHRPASVTVGSQDRRCASGEQTASQPSSAAPVRLRSPRSWQYPAPSRARPRGRSVAACGRATYGGFAPIMDQLHMETLPDAQVTCRSCGKRRSRAYANLVIQAREAPRGPAGGVSAEISLGPLDEGWFAIVPTGWLLPTSSRKASGGNGRLKR